MKQPYFLYRDFTSVKFNKIYLNYCTKLTFYTTFYPLKSGLSHLNNILTHDLTTQIPYQIGTDYTSLGWIYKDAGLVYLQLQNTKISQLYFNIARDYFLKAEKLFESYGDFTWQTITQQSLAFLYYYMKDYQQAEQTISKAIQTLSSNNSPSKTEAMKPRLLLFKQSINFVMAMDNSYGDEIESRSDIKFLK